MMKASVTHVFDLQLASLHEELEQVRNDAFTLPKEAQERSAKLEKKLRTKIAIVMRRREKAVETQDRRLLKLQEKAFMKSISKRLPRM